MLHTRINPANAEPVLSVRDLSVWRGERHLLNDVTWVVSPGERWVVLGANGSGKTTLVRVATWWDRPSAGELTLLGHTLGRADVRSVRTEVGFVSVAFADKIRPGGTAHDVVVSARHGALETWWHHYTADDHARAAASLAEMAMAGFGERTFGSLSSGERQRVLLARALMADAPLIVLDEPSAGLDLGGREDLLGRLDALGADPTGPAQVLITHHPEEIPPSFTHVLLIRDGRVSAAGPIDEVLTSESLSDTFGLTLHLERRDGRFTAWAAT